jgi:hypothetical protein
MNEGRWYTTVPRPALAAVLLLTLWAASALPGPAAQPRRAPAGKCVTADGTLLARQGPVGTAWQAVAKGATLYTGDMLVGLPGAALESKNGAVQLKLLADVDKRSPFPVLEAAVVLHEGPGFDLDFTLDRGRVDLTNQKGKGAARVRVRFHNEQWELTLAEPGTRVALELYGRWPKGAAFTTKPGPRDVPNADLVLLALKGQVELKAGPDQHLLTAPPGPALIQWDNVDGVDKSPHRLEKAPAWADLPKEPSERIEQVRAALEKFRQLAVSKSLEAAVEESVNADDPRQRNVAVVILGATDNLVGFSKVFNDPKHLDLWDTGVLVLRHWIGRGPGQDLRLYQGLIDKRQYSPAHAETVLQLLHSFGDADLARPETYQMLVSYLGHDKLGVRGLAHWHLYRLVPEGQEIGYNPLAPKEERDRARARWKKLIDKVIAGGQLPPKPKPKPGGK